MILILRMSTCPADRIVATTGNLENVELVIDDLGAELVVHLHEAGPLPPHLLHLLLHPLSLPAQLLSLLPGISGIGPGSHVFFRQE